MTSNSYHIIHVDFILFRFHITISMCHVFYKFQFISSTCMACQIIFKTTYTYTMTNRNISKSYQIHTGSNRTDTQFNSFSFRFIYIFIFKSVATRIPDLTRLVDPSRSPIYSDIFNYLLKTFCFVLLNFVFKSVATRIPDLTRLVDPRRSPVYSDIFNYLLKTFCLVYSIIDFLITWKHFILGRPINIYNYQNEFTINAFIST